MVISEIYNKYQIMPLLRTHMLRVAGVAALICVNFNKSINKDAVIQACLLHDIGNWSKIKLGVFPEHEKARGQAYWEKVQKAFIKRYGKDDHKASLTICKELKVKSEIVDLVRQFGFKNTRKIFKSTSSEVKICVYSDMRVAPFGVIPLNDRLEEGKNRYTSQTPGTYSQKQFREFFPLWSKIEEQIFYKCKLKPADITDRKVMQQILKLKNFDIATD